MTVKCYKCGVESDCKQGFVRASQYADRNKLLCLSCKEYFYHTNYISNDTVISFLGFAFLGFVISHNISSETNPWFYINIGIIVLMFYPTIIIHELGHFLAAKLVGYIPVILIFGRGKQLYEKKIGSTYISFNIMPVEGLTLFCPIKKSYNQFRLIIVALGGPLINILIAEIIRRELLFDIDNNFATKPGPLVAFMLANYYIGIFNLLPFKINTALGKLYSDGEKLITIPFYNKENLNELYKSYYFAKYYVANRMNNDSACLTIAEEGIKKYPKDTLIKQMLGTAYLHTQDYEKAYGIFKELLREEHLSELERALICNNLAWNIFMQDDKALLEEAVYYSNKAMEIAPWNMAVRSTRGAILNMQGRYEEAVKILDDKRFVIESVQNRARVLCSLAMAHSKIGNFEAAKDAIKHAKKLDSDCDLLLRAESYLSAN